MHTYISVLEAQAAATSFNGKIRVQALGFRVYAPATRFSREITHFRLARTGVVKRTQSLELNLGFRVQAPATSFNGKITHFALARTGVIKRTQSLEHLLFCQPRLSEHERAGATTPFFVRILAHEAQRHQSCSGGHCLGIRVQGLVQRHWSCS